MFMPLPNSGTDAQTCDQTVVLAPHPHIPHCLPFSPRLREWMCLAWELGDPHSTLHLGPHLLCKFWQTPAPLWTSVSPLAQWLGDGDVWEGSGGLQGSPPPVPGL